jgi:Tfp pilus assembly protein PilX
MTHSSHPKNLLPKLSKMKSGWTEREHGFALVLALSLMAFVLLLLMTLGGLVQVESRSSQTQLKQIEAQQAALLGLNIAIGELQKTAGPD